MTEDAEFYFKRFVKRYKAEGFNGSDADLDQAIVLVPDNLKYRWERGSCRYGNKAYQLALEDFSKIVELGTDMQDLEYAYRMLAILHSALDAEEFYADLDWLVEHDTADDTVYFYRGYHQFELGHYQEALEDFNEALELEPGVIDYWLQRSNVYAQFKRYEDQISDLNIVLNFKNLDMALHGDVYLKRATALFKLGDQAKAYADYDESVRLSESPSTVSAADYFSTFSE